MKLYKLTNDKDITRNGTEWGKDITHSATGLGQVLCTDGFLHAYTHPLLAVLGNPIHANFPKYHLWEAEGDVAITDGFKVGCKTLTTLKRIEVPKVSTTQRVRFAILCALEVYTEEAFVKWAQNWLDESDRTRAAAEAAVAAAWNAEEAARAAARAAAWAAGADEAGAGADEVEARAARAAEAAAEVATWGAAGAAGVAGAAAAEAGAWAAGVASLNLAKIAERAINEK